ncbi:MAG: efflux RND transporter periplasmic adaptor subunit [Geobacteraceae bacterium]|nr:efflux RND transporter periplasmic adaptor subunit [Geobacteraceae bacterium]
MTRLCKCLLLNVLLLSIFSCKAKAPQTPKGRPPAPVSVASATIGTVPVYLEAIGTVESLAQVSIKTMVNGEIKKVHFTEGQDVSKGAVLFTIDPRPFETALKKGEADLARIRAQLATAKTNAERYGKLVKEGIVTAEQYDLYRTQAESLEADLSSQQANIDSLKVQLSYCTIRSPISGRTGNLMITVGNVVKANDTVSLVTINQMAPIAVSFTVPEPELAKARSAMAKGGLIAEATPSGETGKAEQGRVNFIDNSVDAATGTIKLKATFQNVLKQLWPGQSASVRVLFPPIKDAVTVPTQAVQTGQQGEYVYVVRDDMTVDLRVVKTGARSGSVTVVSEGLKSGEQVVTDGHIRLGPGAKIEVRTPGKAPALKNSSSAKNRAGA